MNGSINDLIKTANEKHYDKNKEYLRKGQFQKCRYRGLKPEMCRLFLIDMLQALYYCHNIVKIIHPDIKPDNIMVNHNNEAVLIDFGVSALLEDKKQDPSKQTVGTFQYFAPEMFKKKEEKKLGAAVDIWALGVTMYYMLTGQHPH